jgi:alpha-glucosidase
MDDYAVAFPKGHEWYDFWTGLKVPPPPRMPSIAEIASGTPIPTIPQIHPPLDTMPVYVRGGSILPVQPLIQSTDETPMGPLELHIYPGTDCSGSLYFDDGHTFRYQQGEYLRQNFTCKNDANSMRVNFSARQGSYSPWWNSVEIVIYDWPSASAQAKLSGSNAVLRTTYDRAKHALHVPLPDVPGESELSITSR